MDKANLDHLTIYQPIETTFFNNDACVVAQSLLGKLLCVRYQNLWLRAQIIETEAYYLEDKASHASLGYTEKRKALFMAPGTIYMYYARGGDSLNISCRGEGNAVLIKSAYPYLQSENADAMLATMHRLNPTKDLKQLRAIHKLCGGQTLLCKSLGLRVIHWDQRQFDPQCFYIADLNYQPTEIINTKRLGIPVGRDEQLFYRFIDANYVKYCTKNPLTMRNAEVISLKF
ncbi:MAG: DNA-3-methyladenine glycosylase [Gammaproteobacteria bacterium]